jgi:hypothetical protein
MEQIQRQAFFTLFDTLNSAIDVVAAEMEDSDIEFAQRTGATYEPIVVSHIESGNFYEGHRPSLIDAPLDKYPNCSIWALSAAAAEESQLFDHSQVFNTVLSVEVMVKASPTEGEGIVNKRTLRTIEAVHYAFMADPTLGGIVSAIGDEPSVDLSEVFTRKERSAYGAEWFWQAGRLQYVISKTSNIQSNSGFTLDYPGIDQA